MNIFYYGCKYAQKINTDNGDDVYNYIYMYVTGRIPKRFQENEDVKLVINLKTHAHSEYCHQHSSCTFDTLESFKCVNNDNSSTRR